MTHYSLSLKRRQPHPQSRLQKEIRGKDLKGSSCQPPGQHPPITVNCTHPTGNTNKPTDVSLCNGTRCHRRKQCPNMQVVLNQNEPVSWPFGRFVLEEIKLETLNFTHNNFLLLEVKLWLENSLYDRGKCEIRLQSYVHNAHFSPSWYLDCTCLIPIMRLSRRNF